MAADRIFPRPKASKCERNFLHTYITCKRKFPATPQNITSLVGNSQCKYFDEVITAVLEDKDPPNW